MNSPTRRRGARPSARANRVSQLSPELRAPDLTRPNRRYLVELQRASYLREPEERAKPDRSYLGPPLREQERILAEGASGMVVRAWATQGFPDAPQLPDLLREAEETTAECKRLFRRALAVDAPQDVCIEAARLTLRAECRELELRLRGLASAAVHAAKVTQRPQMPPRLRLRGAHLASARRIRSVVRRSRRCNVSSADDDAGGEPEPPCGGEKEWRPS
jgi:hypothetical protein